MKFTKMMTLAGLSTGVATTAMAGDLEPVVTAVPVAVVAETPSDWSGLYGGLALGFGTGTAEVFMFGSSMGEIDQDRTTYGVFLGYQHDFGRIVAGAEVSYDIYPDEFGGVSTQEDILRVRARLGYDFGKVMVYAAGGYARYTDDSDDYGPSDGWTAGIGVDYALSDHITLGAAYDWTVFEPFREAPIIASYSNYNIQMLELRVSYRF